MSVIFRKTLFGEKTEMESITPASIKHGDDGYFLHCKLGECDMKHYVENNK